MRNGERVFYTSENGDRWILRSGEDDIVSIRHVPNAASGGEEKTFELGGFLIEQRHSAQNQALRALISSLTRSEQATPSDRYINYLEAFTADCENMPGAIEFRCSFALNSDHELRHFKLRVPALPNDSDGERNLIIVVIFEGMEGIIDNFNTADGAATN